MSQVPPPFSRWLCVLLLPLAGACASYEEHPLRPERTESAFRNRTLADEGLSAFISSRVPTRPADWSLDLMTLAGFYYHPELEVARARVGLAEAGLVRAGMSPNPSVSLSPGMSANAPAGVKPWILGFAFDIPIETAGKKGRREDLAERLTQAARFDLGQAAWEVRSRLRSALSAHLLAVLELQVLAAEEGARAQAASLIEKKRVAGEVSRPEVDLAQIELATTQLAIRPAEGRVIETRAQVAQAIGVPETALAGVTFSWPDFEKPPEEDVLSLPRLQQEGLLNRLDVRKTLADYAASEAALALEISNQYPDVHLGPGYFWDEGEHKFNLGLSVTLPVLNRNEGPIAEAEARRRETEARFRALQARVIGETEQVLARYRAAIRELADATALVARLDAREQSAKKAVDLGEEDPLTLAGVRVQRAVAARARVDALGRVQAALGALEDAAQRPLSPPGVLPDLPPARPNKVEDR